MPMKPGGEKLVVYTDLPECHLLEFANPPDNRFTSSFCSHVLEALENIVASGNAKPLLTTSTSPKFYSNGLDFESAVNTPKFFENSYYPVMEAFLRFPWPTVALVNGHAFAAGFLVAACHDHIVMNPDAGFLCMNEVQFGAPLLPPMMTILRVKYGARITQKITFVAHRFTGEEAYNVGLVDALGGFPKAKAAAASLAIFAKSPSYAMIRQELYHEVIAQLQDKGEPKYKL